MLGRGTRVAVLCGRERVLEIYDATTLKRLGEPAPGSGRPGSPPTAWSSSTSPTSLGEALLVYHLRPFELIRRVHLGGGPYAIAFDRERWGLWITLTDQPARQLRGGHPAGAPRHLPSIRDAREVSVDGDR